MTNVNKVFELVCRLLNKTAYTAYVDFNRFAPQASLNLFMEKLGLPNTYQAGRAVAPISAAITERISEDLRGFIESTTIQADSAGKASLPSYCAYVLALRSDKGAEVKVIEPHEKAKHLRSSLLKPTADYPVAVGIGDTYEVHPKEVTDLELDFYIYPQAPVWAFTLVNGRPVYDPVSSVDFDWPETCMYELIVRILAFYGVNMKAQDVLQYAEIKKRDGN